MIEDKKQKHTLQMEDREKLQVTGVTEVLAFDEENVMMETYGGLLIIKGQGIHMDRLDLTLGEVAIVGILDSISYSDRVTPEKTWLSKLFR